MDRPAPKRSLCIQNRKITNDSEDGEPERNKCATSQKSEFVGVESSERDGKYLEAGGSSTSPKPCTIQQLPPVVLATIFSYLTFTRSLWSLKIRLVCKHWCHVYDDVPNKNVEVYFTRYVPSVVHLENCGFRHLAVQFKEVNLGELPQSMWQKIGHRIHSIVLRHCHIGDKGLKNLIRHCCNLQSLLVELHKNTDEGDLFCTPKMLRELDITQKNLETFEIFNIRRRIDVKNWIKIFQTFIEVFPNVIHYTAAYRDIFRFRFLKEFGDENDVNEIATILAFSLSSDDKHHRLALNAASKLRLNDISLKSVKSCYTNEDETTLTNFFSNCNNLKFIEVNLAPKSSLHMLKTLFLQILKHCSDLRKLLYCQDALNRWFPYNSEIEFVQIRNMCPSLEKLSTNDFHILINQSSILINQSPLMSYYETYKPCLCPWLELSLEGIVKTYPNLQHLDVKHSSCTDEMFQSIFQHLINLRTLSVSVTYENTDAGITGRVMDVRSPNVCTSVSLSGDPISTPSTSGYSVNHLKNLEELKLFGFYESSLSDEIFFEFKFPKLHYLKVDRPKKPLEVLPIMGQSMPLLETISFMTHDPQLQNSWTKSLVPFSEHMKKLFKIMLPQTILCVHPGLVQSMSLNDVLNVFRVCPSLRFIKGDRGTCARYLPDTQEIILTEHDGKWNNFFIK